MNHKITTDIISTTGINITKYDILPAKVFINGVEVTDTESWNKAISTFSELQDKINNLQSKIDKAIEYIEKSMNNPQPWHEYLFGDEDGKVENLDKLLNILREEKTDEETVQS